MPAAVKKNKSKTKNKNNMKIRKIGVSVKNFLAVMIIVIIAAVIFLSFTNKYFFKIKNIRISENGQYTYEEILKASGITPGKELYGFDMKKAKEKIKDILTYADSVTITRIPPSTVDIEIKTDSGLLGIMLGGDYYIVSPNLKVVDKIKVVSSGMSESDFEPPEGIITFETDAVKKCYMGEKIEFSDDDVLDILKEIISLYENSGVDNDAGMLSSIKSIDLTNKFKVVMNYGDRFLLKFGIFENISPKILNSFEIMKQLPDYAEGTIDMTDVNTASFTYDENISELYSLQKSGANK